MLIDEAKRMASNPFFQILLLLIIFDIITGVSKGIKNKKLASCIMTNGLIKHTVIILIAFVVGIYSNALEQRSFGVTIILAFIGSYGLSLLENLDELGIAFPESLRKLFKQMEEKEIEEDKKEDD